MLTKFDIGDEIQIKITAKVVGYSADENIDCFKVRVTNKIDDQSQGTYLFLSTRDLTSMCAELVNEPCPDAINLISIQDYIDRKKEKNEEM